MGSFCCSTIIYIYIDQGTDPSFVRGRKTPAAINHISNRPRTFTHLHTYIHIPSFLHPCPTSESQNPFPKITMEVKFGEIDVDDTIVSFKWESHALKNHPGRAIVEFDWKDQGWGNQKGNLSLRLMSPGGDEKVSHNLTPNICPHTWEHIRVDLKKTAPVIEQATEGCWYKLVANIGSGGGFELYVQDFVLSLAGECRQQCVGL